MSGRSAYLSPSSPTTEQDIQQPTSPPSRSSTASTRCPLWTFYPFLYKSAPTSTRVHDQDTSKYARRYKAHHRAPSTTTRDQAQRQQASHDIQHWRSRVATPSPQPLPQRMQVQTSTSSRWTFQGASTLQQQRLQDQPPTRQVQHERHLQRQRPLAMPW